MNTEAEIVNRRKRVKMRRLADLDENIEAPQLPTDNGCTVCRKLVLTLKGLMVALLVVLILVGTQHINDEVLNAKIKNFVNTYRKHYYQIVHNTHNYCDPHLNVNTLFARIYQHQILHQGRALQHLKLALRNNTNFNAIAIVGPSGVGKSMLAEAIQQHFPWEENVHSYAWNTHVPDESEKFHMVRLFMENLSDCGRNLLIFDSLTPCDQELVPIINKIITRKGEGIDFSKKHIIVIYIFRLNSMDYEAPIYERNYDELQNLPNTLTINFKPFGYDELEDCIRRETIVNNLTLTENDITEIKKSMDPKRSGCKMVCAKVLTYGKPV